MVIHNRSDNYQPSQWHLLVPSSSNQIRRGPDVAAAAACARQLCFFIAMMHFTERAASHRSPHRNLSSCSSWSSVRNINQRYVHRSKGSNRARPKSRKPPSPSSRIDPISPARIFSLASRFENFLHTPLADFPPSSAFDRFRPYQLSSSFLSLSTLAADIDLFLLPASASLSSSQCQCCSLRSASINILQFYRLASHRPTGRRDRPRRIHTRTCRLCDSPFLQIILFGSLCRRRDGPPQWMDRSSKIYFSMKFCEIEIEIELEGRSCASYGGEEGRFEAALETVRLKLDDVWRKLVWEDCTHGSTLCGS